MWVRGLKLRYAGINGGHKLSHPVWVRGLKPQRQPQMMKVRIVAPRVGAWIETINTKNKFALIKVAPRVGAWIETLSLNSLDLLINVAPRVGAWIETVSVSNCLSNA